MASRSKTGSGFEYYLQRRSEDRASATTGAPFELLRLLQSAEGEMPILDLAAKAAMEIMLFMEAVRKMQGAGLITLVGSEQEASRIQVAMTPAGDRVASLFRTETV